MIFVSVPTPNVSKKQELGPLKSVLTLLTSLDCKAVVVVKCTVLPGTMDRMAYLFPTLRLVHNPEFLTERNAFRDFMTQPSVLLSGKDADVEPVAQAYLKAFPHMPILRSAEFTTTETAKYIHNCFLATKVAFLNEVAAYCKGIGADYAQAAEFAAAQGVIGNSHIMVPGHDGKPGFGGSCFVKDTAAWLSVAEGDLSILKAAVDCNKKVRPSAYDGSEKCGNS